MSKYELNDLNELEVFQDGENFYNETTGDVIWTAPHGVANDFDFTGAIECRKQFEAQHTDYVLRWNS